MKFETKDGKMFVDKKEVIFKEEENELTFAEEIHKYPERFETLTENGWEVIDHDDGISKEENAVILNDKWNYCFLDHKLFYVEFGLDGYTYKEIIRRKQ